jgi:hypothetical protein
MFRFSIVFFFLFSGFFFSQKVSGFITDEEGNPLPATLVFNLQTEQKSYTDLQGSFSIDANPNQELRFIRVGFERFSKIISSQDFNYTFRISLYRNATEIEEVEILHQPTGNLAIDGRNFGDNKATAKLKLQTSHYIRAKSSVEVLQAKPGEFVQPVGSGFFIGGPNNKWDDVDFMNFLLSNIQPAFFIEELKLTSAEIQPFIFYIFKNFDRKKVLAYGICSQYDLSRFIDECYLKVASYKKNLPNDSLIFKKKRR